MNNAFRLSAATPDHCPQRKKEPTDYLTTKLHNLTHTTLRLLFRANSGTATPKARCMNFLLQYPSRLYSRTPDWRRSTASIRLCAR